MWDGNDHPNTIKMDLTSIRFDYTKSPTSPVVESPLQFLKLAIQDLNIPYVYLKRTLNLSVATGASFRVQNFDVGSPDVSTYTDLPLERGQWLVSKHIPPPTPELLEELSVDDGSFDVARLAEVSLELRVLGHQAIRDHENIVDLVGFSWEKKPDDFGRRWPILVTENANYGSLAHFFQNADPHLRTSHVALSLAADIAAGLAALHDCEVVHSDLKPQSILVFEGADGTVRAKLSDFGSAIVLADHVVSEGEEPSILPLASTRPWEAPEAYQSIPLTLLSRIDVYAFGLLFCYLLSLGASPFENISSSDDSTDTPHRYDFDAITSLKTRDRSMIEHAIQLICRMYKMDDSISHHAARVVEATLHSRPTKRLEMREVARIVTKQEESDETES
jgi:serine/threonine protein kinase